MKKILILLLLSLSIQFAHADSPLTSTPFYTVYKSHKMVAYSEGKTLDKKILKFLGKAKTDIVLKIAVINALGWGNADNVTLFENYLLDKRKGLDSTVFEYLRTVSNAEPEETDQTRLLSVDDLACWSYLNAMGDYFYPDRSMRGSYLAHMRNTESMAHIIPFTLIAAQKAFDINWCEVFMIPQRLLVETSYSKETLSPDAVKIIMEYIELYKADCDQ